jgi:hypothetical protein
MATSNKQHHCLVAHTEESGTDITGNMLAHSPANLPTCCCCCCHRSYRAATPNCTTRDFLWVGQEEGPAGPRPLYVPLIGVMTTRKVEAGEEATWSYGDPYWSGITQNVQEYQKGQELEAALLVGGLGGGPG